MFRNPCLTNMFSFLFFFKYDKKEITTILNIKKIETLYYAHTINI